MATRAPRPKFARNLKLDKEVPPPFANFAKYVDPSGKLNFAGKAVLHSDGVDFSSGNSYKINMAELELREELGKGQYGVVQKVFHKPTKVTMAMKEIRLELDSAKLSQILMELDVLHKSHSPYIVEFYGAFFIESCVYYCMEFMDAGSLDRLYPYKGGAPEDILAGITASVVKGLHFLKQELKIIHRDVKPTNVLANSKGEIKLCDFGVSGQLIQSLAKTNIGCQSYMAPERIAMADNAVYSVASDVWSLGLSLLEIGAGRYPYPPDRFDSIFAQLNAIVNETPPKLPADRFSQPAIEFVESCLKKDAKSRPTYQQLLQHPFLLQYEDRAHTIDMAGWVQGALEWRREHAHPADPSAASKGGFLPNSIRDLRCGHLAEGYFDYLQFHYCDTAPAWSALSIIALVLLLTTLFAFLGTAASEFFCPNLNTIASSLNMSESLAGVTLLAFGNGSPDLFSTFTAIRSASGGLAIGELIGASAFITTLVFGGVAILAPFRLSPVVFLRDALFFLGALAFILVVTLDQQISLLESLLLVAYYAAYVAVVVATDRQPQYAPLSPVDGLDSDGDERGADATPLLFHSGSGGNDDVERFSVLEEDHLSDISGYSSRSHVMRRVRQKLSLLDAVEFVEILDHAARDAAVAEASPFPRSAGSRANSLAPPPPQYTHRPRLRSDADSQFSGRMGLPTSPLLVSPLSHGPLSAGADQAPLSVTTQFLPTSTNLFDSAGSGIGVSGSPTSIAFAVPMTHRTPLALLFPAVLTTRTGSWLKSGALVLLTPLFLVLRVTVPVISREGPTTFGAEVRHPVLCPVQHFCGTAVCVLVVLADPESGGGGWTAALVAAVCGVAVAGAAQVAERRRPGARYHSAFAWLGFVVGMVWIYVVANEVVAILKSLGVILNVSESVLGLTVFAMGASLGDLIANLTIALMGFPTMAVSACFASPMLNLVLGVGVSSAYVALRNGAPHTVSLRVGQSITIVNLGVCAIVALALVYLPTRRYAVDRVFGLGLVAAYVVLVTVALAFGS
ncbi:MAP kinase kinase Wis1 [Blastocladiella emersonii ATCC 22665]|nr:MAP kinase kinase Wis1 [Blastocladiella emersonii ATCC 22665]